MQSALGQHLNSCEDINNVCDVSTSESLPAISTCRPGSSKSYCSDSGYSPSTGGSSVSTVADLETLNQPIAKPTKEDACGCVEEPAMAYLSIQDKKGTCPTIIGAMPMKMPTFPCSPSCSECNHGDMAASGGESLSPRRSFCQEMFSQKCLSLSPSSAISWPSLCTGCAAQGLMPS